jgi:hypothetical protein
VLVQIVRAAEFGVEKDAGQFRAQLLPSVVRRAPVKGTSESAVESGFDGGKKIKGRKRHIVVHTIGCVIQVVVHAANIYDGKAARRVLKELSLYRTKITY